MKIFFYYKAYQKFLQNIWSYAVEWPMLAIACFPPCFLTFSSNAGKYHLVSLLFIAVIELYSPF